MKPNLNSDKELNKIGGVEETSLVCEDNLKENGLTEELENIHKNTLNEFKIYFKNYNKNIDNELIKWRIYVK